MRGPLGFQDIRRLVCCDSSITLSKTCLWKFTRFLANMKRQTNQLILHQHAPGQESKPFSRICPCASMITVASEKFGLSKVAKQRLNKGACNAGILWMQNIGHSACRPRCASRLENRWPLIHSTKNTLIHTVWYQYATCQPHGLSDFKKINDFHWIFTIRVCREIREWQSQLAPLVTLAQRSYPENVCKMETLQFTSVLKFLFSNHSSNISNHSWFAWIPLTFPMNICHGGTMLQNRSIGVFLSVTRCPSSPFTGSNQATPFIRLGLGPLWHWQSLLKRSKLRRVKTITPVESWITGECGPISPHPPPEVARWHQVDTKLTPPVWFGVHLSFTGSKS